MDSVVESIEPFGLTLLLVGAAVAVALLSNRIGTRLRIPAPAIFLLGAALAADLVPALGGLSILAVEQVVTVALVFILFDGGMGIGIRRLRVALAPVLVVGVVGTVLTAVAVAALAHLLFGLPWTVSLLLGTALAPTDPAVVFSVLGNREVRGRAGVILEGESGANDPVGIALLLALLTVGSGLDAAAVGSIAFDFVVQMVVGAAVGVGGGWLLLQAMRRIALPGEGLYPLRTLALSLAIYGLATVAHGSGFLAVFVAGIVIGDASAPFKREIERFHSSLAGLSEMVAFVVLGLTVSLRDVFGTGAWFIGLVLAVLLAFVVRPVLVGPLLLAVRLTVGERVFVLWSGLKGAVPILLGTFRALRRRRHGQARLRRDLRRRAVLGGRPGRSGARRRRTRWGAHARRRAASVVDRPCACGRSPTAPAATSCCPAHRPRGRRCASCTGSTTCGWASSCETAGRSGCSPTRSWRRATSSC